MSNAICHSSAVAVSGAFQAMPGFYLPDASGLRHRMALFVGLLCLVLMTPGLAQTEEGGSFLEPPTNEYTTASFYATWGVGEWIWGSETHDKQTCRLWRAFDVPAGAKVSTARMRISVDNGYRLMLDGREVGTGSDWRSITEYDLGRMLSPGHHVVAVEGFNDNREAGMQFGMKVELADGKVIEFLSDSKWRVAPNGENGWENRLEAPSNWEWAQPVSALLPRPGYKQERIPTMLLKVAVPPPVQLRFWQGVWFQVVLWGVVAFALMFSLRLMARLAVQSKAQDLLHRERARIARDIHDELGARLTELALEGEVIQTELPAGSPVGSKLEALCEKARAVSGAMDEVVWVVNSRRDTLHDFATYACKYAQRFLDATSIRCRLDVDSNLPQVRLDLPVRRSLLLAVKEAINNAAKYSGATEIFLRIHRRGSALLVNVEDNGTGFDLELADPERNGLTNMNERMEEIGGRCRIVTSKGAGCKVEFQVPLPRQAGLPDSSAGVGKLPFDGVRGLAGSSPVRSKEASAP